MNYFASVETCRNFSTTTQILREINFAFEAQNQPFLTISEGQDFNFGKNSGYQKCKISQNQNSTPIELSKQLFLRFQNCHIKTQWKVFPQCKP